jgi:lipoprotein NlpD
MRVMGCLNITAYAHNQKLLVQEKARVTGGQDIAEMGSTGTNQVMLEFQVRLNGKPMNPRLVLPKK